MNIEKFTASELRYEKLIADLVTIERATGEYLTDVNVDAENAGVPHNHEEFYDRCYQSACMAAGFRAEEAGLDINKLIGRNIY